jgi:hypothetical protein
MGFRLLTPYFLLLASDFCLPSRLVDVSVPSCLATSLLRCIESGAEPLHNLNEDLQALRFIAHGQELLFEVELQEKRCGQSKGEVAVGT